MEARIWFRPEMAGDETSLWISCGVELHTSCWNSIVPVSCWNSVASDSPIWTSVYFRVVAETVESSRTKIHWSLCTAVRGSRRTTALRRYIDCGAFAVAWFVRIKRRKLWATCRWMSLSKRTGLWSSLSRREQEEASSTSAAKSRHGSSMQTRIIRSRESFELLVDECHHPNGRACGPHEAAANKKRRAWHQQRRADTDLQCSVTFGSLKCRFFEFSLNPKTTQMAQR